MDTMINTATSTFQTTTGMSYSDVIGFTGSNIKLIAGSGLGLFVDLLPWIIALVVIGAIVYFAYRAFRFYRH